MLARNVTEAELEQAARQVGVRLGNLRPNGRGLRFTLWTKGKPPKYGRRSQTIRNRDGSLRRIPGRVCWHGHRDFFRAVFRLQPQAYFDTALAKYEGTLDFERKFPDTGFNRVDYYGAAAHFRDACDCEEP